MATKSTGKSKSFGGKQAPPFGQDKKSDKDKAEDEKKQMKASQRKTKKGARKESK